MALIDNLISYWKLDETEGATAEDSHGSNDLANTDMTINQTGKIGTSYLGDDNKYLSKATNFSTILAGNFSVSIWIYMNTLQTYYGIIESNPQPGNDGWYLLGKVDGALALVLPGHDWPTTATGLISTGSWHHIVFTHTSDDWRMYVNGVCRLITTRDWGDTPGNLYVANNLGNLASRGMNGKADEIAIWDKVLTDGGVALNATAEGEVAELYNSGDGNPYPFEAPAAGSSMRINIGDVWKDIAPAIPLTITEDTANLDVAGINVLFVDPAAETTITGFTNGVVGQVLFVSAVANGQDITMVHNSGTQKVFLHTGASETLSTEFGGWTLTCDGSNWYDTEHSKHV